MTEYEVVPAGPEDRRDVLDFVAEHFIPHEPINSAINLVQPGYRIPYFDTWLGNHLSKEETLTLLARDVTTGQMLGVCIVQLQRSQEKSDSPPPEDETGPCYSVCPDKLRTIFEFLDMLKGGLDLERESGVEEWCEVMILVCRSDQRTPGLGTELVRRSLKAMEDRGVKVFTTSATSHFSARIFEKLGFTTFKECKYEDYSVEGKVVFPTAAPHTSAKQLIKL